MQTYTEIQRDIQTDIQKHRDPQTETGKQRDRQRDKRKRWTYKDKETEGHTDIYR